MDPDLKMYFLLNMGIFHFYYISLGQGTNPFLLRFQTTSWQKYDTLKCPKIPHPQTWTGGIMCLGNTNNVRVDLKKKTQNMGVSKNGGTQQPWVFLLKMIILGCFGGTTILGNPHISENLPCKLIQKPRRERERERFINIYDGFKVNGKWM